MSSRAEIICKSLIAKGRWNKTQCALCRKLHRETCKILAEQTPYIKSDVDRDYDRAVNAEMNDSEHRRIR